MNSSSIAMNILLEAQLFIYGRDPPYFKCGLRSCSMPVITWKVVRNAFGPLKDAQRCLLLKRIPSVTSTSFSILEARIEDIFLGSRTRDSVAAESLS